MTPPSENITSLFQLIEKIHTRENSFFWQENKIPQTLWFRGHKNHTYTLLPSLYRKMEGNNPKTDMRNKELALLEEFATKNYFRFPYKLPENQFLWMSIMQHYGVSTRFLDWSEALIPSLFFALEEFFLDRNIETTEIPCIWILDPFAINKAFIETNKKINHVGNTIKQNLIPSILSNLYNEIENMTHPLAMISPYNSERIAAQSGSFVLFPGMINLSPIKFRLEILPNSHFFLRKFLLIKPKQITNELKILGIRRSMFYPEMASTSKEIEEYILKR
ncbi:MAG: FRG domain-containing protein [Anaerolineaceae bacterium]|nr:FRG domain-containing protein [Anaerolineaceae bacterium]